MTGPARRRRPTVRGVIVAVTAVSLVLSFGLSAVWFAVVSGDSRYEPAVQSLGLLAGIAGVIAERRAATLERRAQALTAVRAELVGNRDVLGRFATGRDGVPRREVYPRVLTSAVDGALASAVLSTRDELLVRRLQEWRDAAATFNQQLTIAELLAFMQGSQPLLVELHQALHAPDGPVPRLRARLAAALELLPAGAG